MSPRRETQNSQNPQSTIFSSARAAISALIVLSVCTACGKKGPPLPPLVKLPTPPAEFSAARRADTIEFQFVVPATNTDGTRPANLDRVEVYALPAPVPPDPLAPPPPAPTTVDELLKSATLVASVAVKGPRDPNATIEPEDPDSEMEAPEGTGVDQGVVARAVAGLATSSAAAVAPGRRAKPAKRPRVIDDDPQPLVSPRWAVPTRTYIGVGVTAKGRKGPVTAGVAVSFMDPPSPPDEAEFTYDEDAITVTWTPARPRASVQDPVTEDDDVLPSRPIGVDLPTIAYNVYDASTEQRLTPSPIAALEFSDPRMTWGEERCYDIRAVETLAGFSIESAPASTACETLVDTFPPAAPEGLDAVPSDGAISLIWEPNSEKDLAGYIVFRGAAPGDALESLTPTPIKETFFKDTVVAGVAYVYAIQAVDTAGNASELSTRKQESARD